MKPELMYVKGSIDPTFLSLNISGFDLSEDRTGDYVFAFSKLTHYCIGSSQVNTTGDTIMLAVEGDDTMTTELENVAHGEEFGFGYYDAQTDKFYELEADFIGAGGNIVNSLKFYGLNLLKTYQLNIKTDADGNFVEVPLQINTDITQVVLDTIVPETWKTGDNAAIALKVIAKNVENVTITVQQGNGNITHYEKPNWINGTFTNFVYNVHPTDSVVKLVTKGVDIFTKTEVFDEDIIQVEHQKYADVVYENEHVVFYKSENSVMGVAKAANVLMNVQKYETSSELSTKANMRRGWFLTTTPRIIGNYIDFRSNGGKWKVFNFQLMIDRIYVKQPQFEIDIVVQGAEPFHVTEVIQNREPLPEGHADLPDTVFINHPDLVVGVSKDKMSFVNRTETDVTVTWKDNNAKTPKTKGVRLTKEQRISLDYEQQMQHISGNSFEIQFYYKKNDGTLFVEKMIVNKKNEIDLPPSPSPQQFEIERTIAQSQITETVYIETPDFIFEELPCGTKFKVTSKHIIEARNAGENDFFILKLRPTWNPNPLAGLDISVFPGTNNQPSKGREYTYVMLNFNQLRELAKQHNKQWKWSLSWKGKTEYFTLS